MGSQGRTPASGWAGAETGSRQIQLPHFHFKVMKKKRKRQEERLGPGTYNIRGFLQETRPSSLRGICDTREPRFGGGRRRKGAELSAGTAKSFLDELVSKENKKKGCFSTLQRNPGCPSERIFWATLSQCPRDAHVVGPGSYDPKPVGGSADFNQPPFWSSAKRFDRKSDRLFSGNENPVGVGRYNVTKHENYPRKLRYQSLYLHDAQRYLSNLKQDAYLLERLRPVAKNNWRDLISAPRCPDICEEITPAFHV